MPGYATRVALRELGRRAEFPGGQLERPGELIAPLVTARAPGLLALYGIGPHTAALLLIAAGDHPGRLRSEAAWAHPIINAPAEAIFAVLADPAKHAAIDGTGWVREPLDGQPLTKPSATGWDVHRIARAWAELMARLGYGRFLAMGSDWGTSVSTSLALQHPGRLVGIHLVPPLAPPDRAAGDLSDDERAALADLDERSRTGSGYSAIQGTRPQTIGYSLTDSPAALCAWIVEKLWAWTDHPGDLEQVLSADQVLDNITLYWLTGTGASSARLYWESIAQVTQWFTSATSDFITIPAGCSVFPKEVPRPSRRWAQRRFTNIVHWKPARPRRPFRRVGTARPVPRRSPRRGRQLCPATSITLKWSHRGSRREYSSGSGATRMPCPVRDPGA